MFIIVGTAFELGRTAFVAHARLHWLLVAIMITRIAFGTSIATGDPVNQRIFINLKFNHMIELPPMTSEQTFKRHRLAICSGIAVKYNACGDRERTKRFINELIHDNVRHQPARVHYGLSLLSDRRLCLNRSAEHIARRKLHHVVCFDQMAGLRSLARARWSQQDDVHEVPPLYSSSTDRLLTGPPTLQLRLLEKVAILMRQQVALDLRDRVDGYVDQN